MTNNKVGMLVYPFFWTSSGSRIIHCYSHGVFFEDQSAGWEYMKEMDKLCENGEHKKDDELPIDGWDNILLPYVEKNKI